MSAAQLTNYDYSHSIADALRRAVGHFKKPAAIVSERTGRSMGAAKKWLAGENGPGGAELIEAMREFDEVYEAVLQLAGRAPVTLSEEQLQAARRALELLTGRAA